MESLAYRCTTVAAAALTVGGLVALLNPVTPSLPDVQIRDVDLVAANVDGHPVLDIVENHIRPDIVGGVGEEQHINLGDLLFGPGDGSLATGSTFNVGNLDESLFNELAGGNFDPQNLPLGVPFGVDLGVFEAPTSGTFSGGSEQAAGTAAATALTGIALMMPGIPEMQQALNSAIITMESEFNSSLVAAQEAAAERLFGDNPEVNDVVTWIFSLNNTVLAHNQDAFNSLFGISFDTQSSLLSNFAPELAEMDWNTLLGFSPEEFNDIVNAIQADNLALLLGHIDWSDWFSGLF